MAVTANGTGSNNATVIGTRRIGTHHRAPVSEQKATNVAPPRHKLTPYSPAT